MKSESVHLKGWQSVRDSKVYTSTDRAVKPEGKWEKREEGGKVQETRSKQGDRI